MTPIKDLPPMPLNPSATTFDQLRAGGLDLVVANVCAANPGLVEGPPPKFSGLASFARTAVSDVDAFIHGDPIPVDEAAARWSARVAVLAVMGQALAEVGEMVAGNPGVVSDAHTRFGVGHRRTFDPIGDAPPAPIPAASPAPAAPTPRAAAAPDPNFDPERDLRFPPTDRRFPPRDV